MQAEGFSCYSFRTITVFFLLCIPVVYLKSRMNVCFFSPSVFFSNYWKHRYPSPLARLYVNLSHFFLKYWTPVFFKSGITIRSLFISSLNITRSDFLKDFIDHISIYIWERCRCIIFVPCAILTCLPYCSIWWYLNFCFFGINGIISFENIL